MSFTLDLFASRSDVASLEGEGASRVSRLAFVAEGAEGLARLEPVWRRLSESARDQCVFQTYGFARSAARYHEERGERVIVAVAEWEGRPACILPVVVRRRGGVRVGSFLGDPIAQYGDALMAAGAPVRTAELALKRLANCGAVDVFEFRRVRDDAALGPALRSFALEVGLAVEAPHADLACETGAETFLLRIAGAKQKRERARSRRRLAERGELRFEALRGPDAIDALRHAFALKRGWLVAQGEASAVLDDPRALAALERLAVDPQDGASLVVGRLTVGGVPAAFEVGLVKGRRFHAYLGAVAEPFAAASPGKTVMEETLAWCLGEGVDLYDLLPPADAYKRRWSNGSTKVRVYVAPVTRVGKLYAGVWLGALRPRLRAALAAMPASLRRRVGVAALKAGAA